MLNTEMEMLCSATKDVNQQYEDTSKLVHLVTAACQRLITQDVRVSGISKLVHLVTAACQRLIAQDVRVSGINWSVVDGVFD